MHSRACNSISLYLNTYTANTPILKYSVNEIWHSCGPNKVNLRMAEIFINIKTFGVYMTKHHLSCHTKFSVLTKKRKQHITTNNWSLLNYFLFAKQLLISSLYMKSLEHTETPNERLDNIDLLIFTMSHSSRQKHKT